MVAAGASILRDTSIGSILSDMVQSSLSLDVTDTERTSAFHTLGRSSFHRMIK